MKTSSFFQRNKVFIIGLLVAALSSAYELISTNGHPSVWIIGWSVAISVLTYVAKNLRGQSASILSTIGMGAASFFQLHGQPDGLTMQQIMTALVLPMTIQILGLFNTSPPKPLEYEKSPTIVAAKEEAKVLVDKEKTPE